MEAIGDVYSENKTGPRTEPWGTPEVTGKIDEVKESRLTEKDLFVR
jgi:hypothetical protein